MPRTPRDLRAGLRRAGFTVDHQTGSHRVWKHPLIPGIAANLPGKDGAAAKPYREAEVRTALRALREARREERS